MWKCVSLLVLTILITLPVVFAVVQVSPGIAVADNEGSVSFSKVTYFSDVYPSANLIQFNLTGALSLNSESVNMTLTPSGSDQMEVSIVDNTEQLTVGGGQVASSQWFSGNSTLVIYSVISSQWVYVTTPTATTTTATTTSSTGQVSLETLITGVGAGSGSVSPNCPGPGGCSKAVGSSVTVTATPQSGWQFSTWSVQAGISCSTNPCAFSMPNNAVTLNATFTQVQVTTSQTQVTMFVSYAVSGGGSPTPPVFHYVLNGVVKSSTLNETSNPVLVDQGTSWSVTPDPLGRSSSSQRWYSNQPLTGASSSTTVVFVFYRQTSQTLSYSISGGGSGYSAPTFQANQFGSPATIALTTSPTSYWFDYGSGWTVAPNPLTGSGSGERWFTAQAISGTIGGSGTLALKYQNQFYLTMLVVPSGAGSTTPNGSGWYNAGQMVTVMATAKNGRQFLSWAGSGAGSYSGSSRSATVTMQAPISETANFRHTS